MFQNMNPQATTCDNSNRPWLNTACGIVAVLTQIGCNGDERSVSVVTEQVNPLTVNAVKAVREESSSESVVYFGELEPRRQSQLRFGKPGVVRTIQGVASRVKAGDTLAELEQLELEKRRSGLEASLQALQQAPLGTNPLREEQLELQLSEIKAEVAKGVILAPFDCVVLDSHLNVGSLASTQMPALHIAEDVLPEVVVSLPRRVSNRLGSDDAVEIAIDGASADCRLRARSPSESVSGSTTVWLAVVSSLDGVSWAFGQTVEVRLDLPTVQSGFWLSHSSLIRDSNGLWSVYTVQDETLAEDGSKATVKRKTVDVVQLRDDWALVEGSLGEGELVVVNGVHRVVTGQVVRVNELPRQGPRRDTAGVAE